MKILPNFLLALVMFNSQAQATNPKTDVSVFPAEKCIDMAQAALIQHQQDYRIVEEMLKKSKECNVDTYRKELKRQKLKNLLFNDKFL